MALTAFPGLYLGAGPVRALVLPLAFSYPLLLRPLAASTWTVGAGSCPADLLHSCFPSFPAASRGFLFACRQSTSDAGAVSPSVSPGLTWPRLASSCQAWRGRGGPSGPPGAPAGAPQYLPRAHLGRAARTGPSRPLPSPHSPPLPWRPSGGFLQPLLACVGRSNTGPGFSPPGPFPWPPRCARWRPQYLPRAHLGRAARTGPSRPLPSPHLPPLPWRPSGGFLLPLLACVGRSNTGPGFSPPGPLPWPPRVPYSARFPSRRPHPPAAGRASAGLRPSLRPHRPPTGVVPPPAWRLAASAVLAPAPGLIERGPSCSMVFASNLAPLCSRRAPAPGLLFERGPSCSIAGRCFFGSWRAGCMPTSTWTYLERLSRWPDRAVCSRPWPDRACCSRPLVAWASVAAAAPGCCCFLGLLVPGRRWPGWLRRTSSPSATSCSWFSFEAISGVVPAAGAISLVPVLKKESPPAHSEALPLKIDGKWKEEAHI